MEGFAHITGIPPSVTRDHLRMAREKMFFSSAKATAELGYQPRPVREAIEDAVTWFRANGLAR
jgi:dihydroflavonol-4-reductase